MIYNKNGRDVK